MRKLNDEVAETINFLKQSEVRLAEGGRVSRPPSPCFFIRSPPSPCKQAQWCGVGEKAKTTPPPSPKVNGVKQREEKRRRSAQAHKAHRDHKVAIRARVIRGSGGFT